MNLKQHVIKEFSEKPIQEEYKEKTRKGLWDSEKKLIKKYFKKGKILDIGCGSGRVSYTLQKKGYEVTPIDITPAMIKSAKELSKEFNIQLQFQLMDATNLKFQDETFDNAIFSFNGWNQIPKKKNRDKALEETYRVLRKGGRFIFTTHIRKIGKYTPFWILYRIKMKLLKPLGIKTLAEEYGDRFFRRGDKEIYQKAQYVHIPKEKEVKEQLRKTSFKILFNDFRSKISKKDKKQMGGDCMFFVCEK